MTIGKIFKGKAASVECTAHIQANCSTITYCVIFSSTIGVKLHSFFFSLFLVRGSSGSGGLQLSTGIELSLGKTLNPALPLLCLLM